MLKIKNIEINSLNDNKFAIHRPTETDVLSIIKRNKLEAKQSKRKNVILAAATVSVLAVSGLLISL